VGELAAVLRALGLLTLLLTSGWAVARVTGRRVDVFAAVWWGLAVTSTAGVVLARAGAFSLAALGIVGAGVTLVALAAGGWRARDDPNAAAAAAGASRRIGIVACAAGMVACGWTWPPFETFLAGADSTMYVDAGIHLARTGSYEVPGTIARLLSPALATALFPGVGFSGRGPFIRLPGGLLMSSLDATSATPAFFPLLPVWTGILAAIGGPELAPAAAPLGMGLAVWAVTLFAGEALGLAVALPTALVFLGNFAVWWFGRFPMAEPLTIAFVWGGLVFLGRGAPLAAGVMLGLGGVARAETLVFTIAALAWWAAWTPVRARDLLALTGGVALAGMLAAVGLFGSPNHHVAYLWSDLVWTWMRMMFRVLPAVWDGRLVAAVALLPMVPLMAGLAASWHGGTVARNTLRASIALAILVGVGLYWRLGGQPEPLRHLGWLVTSMSPLGFALAVVGGGLVWWRGGPAARLSVVLVLLVAAIFVPSPRVSPYQPWAMRRFLPVVLPGLALAAGALLGSLMQSSRWALRVAAAVLMVAVVGLQVPTTLAVRGADYFTGSLAGTRRVAEQIPSDALVVVDSGFADLQIQVPLWLVFGRESVMAAGGRPAWRALLSTLVATGRPVYWIQNRFAKPPESAGLAFAPVSSESDFTIQLPDSPADVPPAVAIRKLIPLRVYGVTAGDGLALASM
jgi:hypothetical protein